MADRPEETTTHRAAAPAPTHGFFYVGGRYVDVPEGTVMVDQCYVSWRAPEVPTAACPIVFIHGGGQTGTNFDGTPDGRLGWADYFCRLGYEVYVVDQPARGRSPYHAEIHGPVRSIATKDVGVIERRLTAMSRYAPYPQAALHTQWPGTGLRGDPVFDEFCASQIRMVADFGLVERMMRSAARALLERIGRAVVVTHSHSGSLGWNIADECPELVAAIVAVEPAGPPFVNLEMVGGEDYAQERGLERPYGVTTEPLAYDPVVDDPIEELWAGGDHRPDGAPAFWHLQPEPARRLANVARVPVIVITAEASYHAVFDDATVAYLRQAGVDVEHVHLADHGLHGNGHMMMLERNNLEIADLVDAALRRRELA